MGHLRSFDGLCRPCDPDDLCRLGGHADEHLQVGRRRRDLGAGSGPAESGLPAPPRKLGSNGMLYISYNSSIGPYDAGTSGSVWKLDTKTGEWTDINPYGGGVASNKQRGRCFLPSKSRYVDGCLDEHIGGRRNPIYRSTDGGETWNSLWEFSSYPQRDNRYTNDYSISPWLDWGVQRDPETDPETSPKLGWMIGDPIRLLHRIMYGTGATLFGSENMTDLDKDEKIKISVMANGIEETAILGLIILHPGRR